MNGNLDEEICMQQLEGFKEEGKEQLVCKLKRSIYGLKQASRQWYLKFHDTITFFRFQENKLDDCVYLKVSGSKFIFLILYVDDILLATNALSLLHETKRFLSKNFEMKDMKSASFVLSIEIHIDRSKKILGLSQKSYITKVVERFQMQNCSTISCLIIKGDKLSQDQCPQNDLEQHKMKTIPYDSVVGSVMYVQIYTCPNISFAVGMLRRFQSNLGFDHWIATKKVMRYLQGTKDLILTYKHSDQFEIVGYSDSDFMGCIDSMKSTSGYVFILAGGAISWKSVKQTITASSTMEAEFIACHEATSQAIWLRNFIEIFKL